MKVLTGTFPAQYGRATGGIVDLATKDKTFFMFNWEGYRYKLGSSGPATVPDASWDQGDCSNLLAPTTSFGTTYPTHKLYD